MVPYLHTCFHLAFCLFLFFMAFFTAFFIGTVTIFMEVGMIRNWPLTLGTACAFYS